MQTTLGKMQLQDDLKRPRLMWRTEVKLNRPINDYFFMDFYNYATVEMNIRRAKRSMTDINLYYGREGWINLLRYYLRAMKEMLKQIVEASYIIPQDIKDSIDPILDAPLVFRKMVATHPLDMTNEEILSYFIKIAKYIECVIKTVNDICLDNLEEQIYRFEHGCKHKQAYSEAEASEMEEGDSWW